jgi:hypothetical protein
MHPAFRGKAGSVLITPTGKPGCIHSTNIKNSQIFFNSMHFAYKRSKNRSAISIGATKGHERMGKAWKLFAKLHLLFQKRLLILFLLTGNGNMFHKMCKLTIYIYKTMSSATVPVKYPMTAWGYF